MLREELVIDGCRFPFVIYRPEKSVSKLPLIVQLHGAGERGDSIEELYKTDMHGFSHIFSKEDADYPCILALPMCPNESFWAAETEHVYNFINTLKNMFDIDDDRVYLTGLSMGGFGTWYTAMRYNDIFAAIAPVCGGGMAWNANALTMPVWAFHGAADDVVNVFSTDEMVEALKKAGRNVKYTRIDGVGHGVWAYAYNEELLKWLLSHKKS